MHYLFDVIIYKNINGEVLLGNFDIARSGAGTRLAGGGAGHDEFTRLRRYSESGVGSLATSQKQIQRVITQYSHILSPLP